MQQGCSKIYREKASGAPADRQFQAGCGNLDCVTDGKSAIAAIRVMPGGSLCASIDPILHNMVMAAVGGCRIGVKIAPGRGKKRPVFACALHWPVANARLVQCRACG